MKTIFRARVLTIAIAMLTGAWTCHEEPQPLPAPRQPIQYVVAVDLSTSLTPAQRNHHEALLHALAGELEFGDRMVLLKAPKEGIQDTAKIRTIRVPPLQHARPLPKEKTNLELARQTANMHVTALFKGQPVKGTDLLATLHKVGEWVATQDDSMRTVLVLFSDMLHCADGTCMENTMGVPDSAWIDTRRRQGLVRSLNGVCVAVVGADASKAEGVRVREFWRRYFQVAGASFDPERYVHSAASPAMLRCAG